MLITDKGIKKALLKALADEEASKVIACATWKAKSVMEIIQECSIPHTSAYRLVNELKEEGLLVVDRVVLTEDGKKYALYRSTFKMINIRFEGNNVEVDATPNRDTIEKAFRLFYSIKGKEES